MKIMRVGGVCQVNLEGDWYIVKLEGRDGLSLEDAQDSIEDNLRKKESQRLNQIWMDKLEREYHVELIDQNPWED